jgi:hypothetical protein
MHMYVKRLLKVGETQSQYRKSFCWAKKPCQQGWVFWCLCLCQVALKETGCHLLGRFQGCQAVLVWTSISLTWTYVHWATCITRWSGTVSNQQLSGDLLSDTWVGHSCVMSRLCAASSRIQGLDGEAQCFLAASQLFPGLMASPCVAIRKPCRQVSACW